MHPSRKDLMSWEDEGGAAPEAPQVTRPSAEEILKRNPPPPIIVIQPTVQGQQCIRCAKPKLVDASGICLDCRKVEKVQELSDAIVKVLAGPLTTAQEPVTSLPVPTYVKKREEEPKIRTHILRPDCPECGKPAIEVSHFSCMMPKTIEGKIVPVKTRFITLKCGHIITQEKAEVLDFSDVVSFSGKKPFKFQVTTAERIVKADFRALARLDVGLGKTIVTLMLLRKYWKQMTPCLIITRSSLTVQWLMEFLDWVPGRICQILETSRDKPQDGFQAFIVSMDLIAPRYDKKRKSERGGLPWLREYPFKTIVFDEIQHIKNEDANRTKFVQDLAAKADYFIQLSGTPIKNHFGEYFNALNILDPKTFRYRAEFYRDYVEHYYDDYGRLHSGGLRQSRYDHFKEITKRYIIDYKKADVMPDLPKTFRQYRYFNLTEEVAEAYGKEMNVFLEAHDDSEFLTGQQKFEAKALMNASLMKLKHIVGLAKAEVMVEDILEWIDAEDEEQEILNFGDERIVSLPKTIVFIHHIDVGTMLQAQLDPELEKRGFEPCMRLEGGISGEESMAIQLRFKNNKNARVLIASTLASGEGKNFQFCSNGVMLERQWNPPNEEQAEGRFSRPGSVASQINMTYPVALGTVDEYLAEVVEKKRTYLATVDGKWGSAAEAEIMQEIIRRATTEGRKRWGKK